MNSKERIEGYADVITATSGYSHSKDKYFIFLRDLVEDLEVYNYNASYKQGAYDFLNSEYDRLKGV